MDLMIVRSLVFQERFVLVGCSERGFGLLSGGSAGCGGCSGGSQGRNDRVLVVEKRASEASVGVDRGTSLLGEQERIHEVHVLTTHDGSDGDRATARLALVAVHQHDLALVESVLDELYGGSDMRQEVLGFDVEYRYHVIAKVLGERWIDAEHDGAHAIDADGAQGVEVVRVLEVADP